MITWSSTSALLEISAAGVTKASTLALLCDRLGVDAADVVAFGDMPNDLPMLDVGRHVLGDGRRPPDRASRRPTTSPPATTTTAWRGCWLVSSTCDLLRWPRVLRPTPASPCCSPAPAVVLAQMSAHAACSLQAGQRPARPRRRPTRSSAESCRASRPPARAPTEPADDVRHRGRRRSTRATSGPPTSWSPRRRTACGLGSSRPTGRTSSS